MGEADLTKNETTESGAPVALAESSSEPGLRRVSIEVKRVQTFLFAVPRLRAMLGANALLGETVRNELPELARAGAALPDELKPAVPKFEEHPDDPLTRALKGRPDEATLADRPGDRYAEGILVRDAGRFIGLFPDGYKANAFIAKAEVSFAKKLPGVRFDVRVDRFDLKKSEWIETERDEMSETQLLDLPVLQPCEESGNEPAGVVREVYRVERRGRRGRGQPPEKEQSKVSRSVALRLDKGDEYAARRTTTDLIGLMRRELPLSNLKDPRDFDDVAGGGYLAVIHADGNGIGALQRKAIEGMDRTGLENWLRREAARESFFHGMRSRVRTAVVDALGTALSAQTSDGTGLTYRPYQLMMLGGDDLLLACRADCALKFVVAYARALDTAASGITIGAGVVIAPSSLPFHRLHTLAEQLAASAKTLYRSGPGVSVVDWMVCTNAWAADPIEERRRFAAIDYVQDKQTRKLVLSAKPYRVLGKEIDSLEGLLDRVGKLSRDPSRPSRPARSQLKALPQKLRAGRRAGDLGYLALPPDTRDQLKSCGFGDGPWREMGQSGPYLTYLPDLIEVSEIATLGQTERKPKAKGTAS